MPPEVQAVIILPLIDKDMATAPVQGWELRRMVPGAEKAGDDALDVWMYG